MTLTDTYRQKDPTRADKGSNHTHRKTKLTSHRHNQSDLQGDRLGTLGGMENTEEDSVSSNQSAEWARERDTSSNQSAEHDTSSNQ